LIEELTIFSTPTTPSVNKITSYRLWVLPQCGEYHLKLKICDLRIDFLSVYRLATSVKSCCTVADLLDVHVRNLETSPTKVEQKHIQTIPVRSKIQ
jgi:hypothetical protein